MSLRYCLSAAIAVTGVFCPQLSGDPATGQTQWQVDSGGRTLLNSSPILYGGSLVVLQYDQSAGNRYGIRMAGFSPTDGRKLWTFSPSRIWRKGGCFAGEVFGVGGLVWAHIDVPPSVAAKNAGGRPSAWVGLDPKTGEIRKRHDDATSDPATARMLANGIHRCNTGRATVKGYLFGTFEFFGCGDGWVYCLRAVDGKLIWRVRVAPVEERIVVVGQVESPWPVHGSLPVVGEAGGRLYLSTRDGRLRCFAAR